MVTHPFWGKTFLKSTKKIYIFLYAFRWGNSKLYLHRCILVQWAPIVSPSNDDNRWACEMSSSRTNVHHPPFCVCYVWFHGSAGLRDSRDSNQVRTTRYGIIHCSTDRKKMRWASNPSSLLDFLLIVLWAVRTQFSITILLYSFFLLLLNSFIIICVNIFKFKKYFLI